MMSPNLEVQVTSPTEIKGIGITVTDVNSGFLLTATAGHTVYLDDKMLEAIYTMAEKRGMVA